MRTPPTDARPTATREPASRREVRRRQAQQIGREQLLDAAEDLFSRRGFHDTSLREVARLAEFSVGSVYSFFETSVARQGLGNYVVLWLIEHARKLGLPYVYLGYWIADSAKMSYKHRFQPLEALRPTGWERMPVVDPPLAEPVVMANA